jgi:hypothetical protein
MLPLKSGPASHCSCSVISDVRPNKHSGHTAQFPWCLSRTVEALHKRQDGYLTCNLCKFSAQPTDSECSGRSDGRWTGPAMSVFSLMTLKHHFWPSTRRCCAPIIIRTMIISTRGITIVDGSSRNKKKVLLDPTHLSRDIGFSLAFGQRSFSAHWLFFSLSFFSLILSVWYIHWLLRLFPFFLCLFF